MDREDLLNKVRAMVENCEAGVDVLRSERQRAVDYYDGQMRDLPADEGRSSMISRDVRATIKKILPPIKRVILGSDEVVEYKPAGENDEESAKQASIYVNKIVIPECRGMDAISDAIASALLLREGVLKWWFDESSRITVEPFSGLTEGDLAMRLSDGAEVLEISEYVEDIAGERVTFYRGRIKRVALEQKIMLASVPLEEFGIDPNARSEDDATIIYHKSRVRRSDLVARGYDRELVEGLAEADPRTPLHSDADNDAHSLPYDLTDNEKALEEVEVYECFVRIDADGDGIAELREVHYVPGASGGQGETGGVILFDDYADEPRLAIIVCERRMHTARGVSVFDDVGDLQRLKTALLRQSLDNIYFQNSPQPIFQEGVIRNPEAAAAPSFGQPIFVRNGVSAGDAIQWNIIPYVADKATAMMEMVDADIANRTGITPAASGLDPNALQDVREQAVSMISDASAAQAWCMVREMAEGGIKRAFRGILKLVVQHQDKTRTVRLTDKWEQLDPRGWNASMDCEVNTGLGTGTKERDLRSLTLIASYQEKLMASLGPSNPFIQPKHIYNTLSRMVEVAGLRTPSLYFAEPQEGAALGPQGPSPDEQKLQAQMQLEQMKMQAARDKESAQAEADVIVKQKEAERDAQKAQLDAMDKEQERAFRLKLEQIKIDAQMQLAREKMAFDAHNAMASSGIDPVTGEKPESALSAKLDEIARLVVSPRVTELERDEMGRPIRAIQRIDGVDDGRGLSS